MSRILIVDDAPSIRALLRTHLEIWEYPVLEAGNGPTALEMVVQEHPDLILLDHHMPGMEGLTVLANIRQSGNDTPVVMLTADPNQSVAVQCFRAGANDFLTKPFDPDYLELVLHRTLREREQTEKLRSADIALAAEKATHQIKNILMVRFGHEIKTLLHQTLSYLDFLGDDMDRTDGKARRWFDKAQRSARELAAFVERLNRLTLLESDPSGYCFQAVSANHLVTLAITGQGEKALQRQIALVVNGDPMLMVQADGDKIVEALGEILDNAIRFSPVGSTISIAVIDRINDLEIAIADQGPGVANEDKVVLFSPFTIGRRTDSGAGGRGLGLAIAARILADHQGGIRVQDHPNDGAVFIVTLPKP